MIDLWHEGDWSFSDGTKVGCWYLGNDHEWYGCEYIVFEALPGRGRGWAVMYIGNDEDNVPDDGFESREDAMQAAIDFVRQEIRRLMAVIGEQ